jgi:hypothetical protein
MLNAPICLSVCSMYCLYYAFIQFSSYLHEISHGRSHILSGCVYIKLAAIPCYVRLWEGKHELCEMRKPVTNYDVTKL